MTNRFRLLSNLLLAGALALGLLAASSITWAEEPGPAALAPPPFDAPELEHFEYWRARGDAARARVAAAQAELDEANATVRRMRRDRHPRGAARQPLLDAQQQAQAAFDEALHHLEVELPEEARRAGAQQSWLQERRR